MYDEIIFGLLRYSGDLAGGQAIDRGPDLLYKATQSSV
jgi:hypothetical protein